jgi:hypothetical protein
MPRTLPVYTCVFCPHSSNLRCSISFVLHAAHTYHVSVCRTHFFLVSQCAGGFLPPRTATSSYSEANQSAGNSNKNPRQIKFPNNVETVALFLNLLASVFSIVVSVLRLLEMTKQP